MIGNKLAVIGRIIMTTTLILAVNGCSSYGSSFGCGDARGAKCMPMDKVDRLIASGEIERFTKVDECRGGSCRKNKVTKEDEVPAIRDGLPAGYIEFSGNNNK